MLTPAILTRVVAAALDEDAPWGDLEREVVHRADRAEGLGEVLDEDRAVGRHDPRA